MRIVFGWAVPGGVSLLRRQYEKFLVRFLLVLTAFGAGLALDGMSQPVESGGFALFAGLAKMLAGAPYLLARIFFRTPSMAAPVHEYGAVLLIAAGLINLLVLTEGRWNAASVVYSFVRRFDFRRGSAGGRTDSAGTAAAGGVRFCLLHGRRFRGRLDYVSDSSLSLAFSIASPSSAQRATKARVRDASRRSRRSRTLARITSALWSN